jgi:hypothetical protein
MYYVNTRFCLTVNCPSYCFFSLLPLVGMDVYLFNVIERRQRTFFTCIEVLRNRKLFALAEPEPLLKWNHKSSHRHR